MINTACYHVYDGWAVLFPMEEALEIFMVAAMAQCCCRSATENDLQEERFCSEGTTLFLG